MTPPIGQSLRPDIQEVQPRWEAFWNGDGKRPVVWAICAKPGEAVQQRIEQLTPPYPVRPTADFRQVAQNILEMLTTCYEFPAETIPMFNPSFGPDQFAGFLGVPINYSPSSKNTSWSEPLNEELEALRPVRLREDQPFLQAMDRFVEELARVAEGRFVVGSLDTHSNFDALVAMRGPENACLDLMENPDRAARVLGDFGRLFAEVYERYYRLGRMGFTGTTSWMPAYSSKRFQTIQSDFICLVSPKLSRRLIIPVLEQELEAIDHSIYHLDGPEALVHLDDILGLKRLHAIQWVPGAAHAPHGPTWFDLYKRILKAGKGLWIPAENVEQVQTIHRELKTSRVIYCVPGTRGEIDQLIRWLHNHS